MIKNTTKDECRPDWLMRGNPRAIEAQEARGQQELVDSTQLPSKGLLHLQPLIEAAGGRVGQAVQGDPLFHDVVLPQGWTKKATDHSMWSELLDDKGQVVASMFYKAAFYDRDAFIHLKQ